MNTSQPQRYIVSHTSLRGIAALLVVIYHLQFGAKHRLWLETATPFFTVGYLWVDLFFILSGFVISYSCKVDDMAPFTRDRIKTIMVARFARIYPLHFVCLFVLLAVTLAEALASAALGNHALLHEVTSAHSILNFGEQILLLNAWGLTGRVGWNIPSWSIGAEAIAYLVFPALAALMVLRRTTTQAGLLLVAGGFYLWVATTSGVLDIVKGVAILRCLAGFSLGMVIYSLREPIARCNDAVLSAAQICGAALALGTMIAGANDTLAIPGFVLLIAATWTDRGLLAVPLRSRLLHWLGEISYSVYLNHFWVLKIWHFFVLRAMNHLPVPDWGKRIFLIAGGIGLVLIVSHFSYRLVETRARKAITNAYRGRSAPL